MLEKRLIPVLLLKDGGLVKTTKFKAPRYVGDPINTVKIFNDKQADELFIVDIGASKNKTGPDFNLLSQIASEAFMPLGYAGGVKTLDEMEKIFSLGFEKVGLNSIFFEKPELIKEAVRSFGSQSIVGIVDVQKDIFNKKFVFNHLKGKKLNVTPLDHALKMQDYGVGEVIIQSIYKDGMMNGYDLDLIAQISKKISIPLIALGGASSITDFKSVLEHGSDAAAAGSFFIYHGPHRAVLINYPKRNVLDFMRT